MDLVDLELPREPMATARAGRRLGPGDGRRDDVFAGLASVLEVRTLARLASASEGDLVDAGGVALARDEPHAALEADLVGVLGVEGSTTPTLCTIYSLPLVPLLDEVYWEQWSLRRCPEES